MTSERALAGLGLAFGIACATGCAGGLPPAAARDPLLRDPDQQPFSATCARGNDEGEEAGDPACIPQFRTSPFAWDALDNSIFYPLTRIFALDPATEATNINALDEVPNSSWFENRAASWFEDRSAFSRGACTEADILSPTDDAPGSWKIDRGKQDGSTAGFRVEVHGKKYLVKIDKSPKMAAAAVLGAVLHHAVGYNTSCEQLIYFDPALVQLEPGLTVTDNTGVTRPFDRAALDRVLGLGRRPDGQVRAQASTWLSGHMLGPFSYLGTRDDDFNDVIPHEDRRELRGMRVLAALIDHIDAREQNSMDVWIAVDPSRPSSAPGYVRHYIMDFSDSFGATWEWDEISRRLGHSYLLDFQDIGRDIVTLGLPLRRWDTVQIEPGHEIFSYYRADDFDPANWKNEYPNPAFSRASERDNAWMARLLARLEPEHLAALVAIAEFEPAQAQYFHGVLSQRLRRILERYLTRLSPLADPSLSEGHLCFTDWARRRGLYPPSQFHYSAELPIRVDDESRVCVDLPAPARPRLVVTIENGQAAPLDVHLDAPAGRYRLLALERRSSR